ncbi:hypothetical protein MML48_9g00005391 [Holotrichia oblita]|uniref:Uncharacterized protein n=1 Tax=Holotrichia oblita TaxID=644536 RepID=A0ACB9SM94_HOLOL|nr:hypothetical protein MML48_9g00005391 [Holotrichia oblita]
MAQAVFNRISEQLNQTENPVAVPIVLKFFASLYFYATGNPNTWLLGDSEYPLQPWLMTPILNAQQGTPEGRYTDTHIRALNCVERCIGVLKTRFRCLLRELVLRYSPEKVETIINVCSILHNICRRENLEDIRDQEEVIPNERQQVQDEQRGLAVRQNIIQRYFN